jgi:hypothetical protein
MINVNTYGKSKAAIILAKLVDDNRKKNDCHNKNRVVSKIWNDYTKGFSEIENSNMSQELTITLLTMWTEKYTNLCKTSKSNMEIKIRTFLENVISTKMKDYLRRTK